MSSVHGQTHNPANHSHHHDHHHGDHGVFHTHAPAGRLRTAFWLTVLILLVEVGGGLLSHSLALLSDAGHVLTDLAAIGLSWFALRQAEKPSNRQMTFGYYRSGILAALVNAIALLFITLWILYEAYNRFLHPAPVAAKWMFVSAGIGLCINLYLGLGMRHESDLNIKSAVLHMLGDAAASAGVIVGGIVIVLTGWSVVDPALSALIALFISYGAWQIVKQTSGILMEGTPKDVDFGKVVETLKAIPGVHDLHDVHIWSITSGKNALSCHITLDGDMTIRDSQQILREMEHRLIHMGIGHVTIQTEDDEHPHEDSELCAAVEGHPHAHS
ncbi:cation transporter [Alicyclobacillus cycloheptanicus]|uniref:Cobalt-zinc-cadmium efflux system protein n=1 Tax=Alicyclobacillus cycloheptanicus TaxID=1457 RepID=A0ABT9XHW7_9BACL|nr:cation diffusion facilitator family transporter [Alicyclobacillus cycloheptanicus]MDQ0189619.1 cobalt-zinc-cadmium efflux system protein [Alicyclobacillus cycloheptanicus]WDL99928.1 cation transporter [Alicyclobacillus cycloheptanicus]